MTLTVNLSSEAAERLRIKSARVGKSMQSLISDIVEAAVATDEPVPNNMADRMRAMGLLGAIDGTPGPGDGRAWSEIEAASDPL